MERKARRGGTRPRVRRQPRRNPFALFIPTRPKAMCPWCLAERGTPWPGGNTSTMCPRHYLALRPRRRLHR